MILKTVYAMLSADAQLAALLGSAPSESRIYPNFAGWQAKPPYLVYRCLSAESTSDSIIFEETATFEAVAKDYSLCAKIIARVDTLLRGAQEDSFPGGARRVFCATPCGGADFADPRGLHVRALTYRFIFA